MTISPKGNGILVALDEKAEWLLPWFWIRYSAHNTLPIAFVDLGLSHYGKSFCSEKGILLTLESMPELSALTDDVDKWQTLLGNNIEESRSAWRQKPFACLQTPFERTLWLDLDCEVIQSLDSLFELKEGVYLAEETEASISSGRELQVVYADEMLYNSGVILYSHDAPLIKKWAQAVLDEGDAFYSDQHVLSRVIYTHKMSVKTLHENYNWRMSRGLNIQAAIVHWVGSWGKDYIRCHGGIGEDLANLPKI